MESFIINPKINVETTGRVAEQQGLNQQLRILSKPKLLDIPTDDGGGQPVHPSVVYIPNGFNGYRYWMAHTPYTNSDNSVENPNIVASKDGINWVVPAGLTNPIFGAPAQGFYADPCLVHDYSDGKLKIWWSWFGSPAKTMYSESTDGVTWSEAEVLDSFTPEQVHILGAGYNKPKIFCAWSKDSRNRIVRRFSFDGKTWGKPYNVRHNLQNLQTTHFTAYMDAGGFHFLMAAYPPGQNIRHGNLYYGFSPDGSSIHFDTVPITTASAQDSGEFNNRQLYTSFMAPYDSEKWIVWTSAFNQNSEPRIGYFFAQVKPKLPSDFPKSTVVFDEYKLRDASWHFSPYFSNRAVPGLGGGRNKTLLIRNNHDQPIKMRFLSDWGGGGTDINRSIEESAFQNITIGSSSSVRLVTKDILPILGDSIPGDIRIQLSSDIPPTTGEISMELYYE